MWPIIFLLTDLINEYYGKNGVKKLTYITVGLISFTYIILSISISIPATSFSPVSDGAYTTVFGQSQWIIVGSVTAFLVSQLVDMHIFWMFKKLTGNKYIWLRATGSTVISQMIDTFIVQFIAFVVPGKWLFSEFIVNASWGYGFKLIVAIVLTPIIYLGHYVIAYYLNKKEEAI